MIKAVKGYNFQSWEEFNFIIESGVTIINGYNYDDETSEGSGKSAILNALCWCLYGKLPKDVKIDEVIREGEKKGGVEVLLGDDVVIRSRGPNELKIMKFNGEGHDVVKGKDSRETQKLIEEMVGMSFETFCQTVYFAQGYNKKFVTANEEDRGKILSEIQDLSVFDRAYKEAHNLIKPEKKKLEDLKHQNELEGVKYNHNLRSIAEHKNYAEQERARIAAQVLGIENTLTLKDAERFTKQSEADNFISESPEKIKEYNDDITSLEARAQEIMGLKSKVELQLSEISNHAANKSRIKNNIDSDSRRVTKLEGEKEALAIFISNPTKTCNTCGSTLDKCDTSHAEKETRDLHGRIAELQSGLVSMDKEFSEMGTLDATELNQQIAKHNSDIQQTNSIIYDLRTRIQNNDRNINQYNSLLQMIAMVDNDILSIKSQLSQAQNQEAGNRDDVIKSLEAENLDITVNIDSINNLIDVANARLNRLENLKTGFKEVKSYTFTSVLNELTRRTNDYLQELFEVPMNLRFTNENMKIGLDIRINKKSRSHGLFSGGQQRRIGLAVDLALSDIVTSRTGTGVNLLILDEYFKDLSESSMTKCLYLLEKLGKPTILIEHNSVFKSIVNRSFDIELRDGKSQMVTS